MYLLYRSLCFLPAEFLELTQGGFQGTLPTELGLLADLKFLYVSQNDFSGTIPTELGKLQLLGTSFDRSHRSPFETAASDLAHLT